MVIKTVSLTKRYGSFTALHPLDLEIKEGEVFGLLGPNGSGKTTTIKMLLGLVVPSGGQIEVLGGSPLDERVRSRLGYLPENVSFYRHLSGEEFLLFCGRCFSLPEDLLRERMIRLWSEVELAADFLRLPLRFYSRGMLQRVGIAQTLLNDPELLLLDEPTLGLDPLGRVLVKKLIRRLKKEGKTILLASHILADAEELCGRIGILVDGKLAFLGKVARFLERGRALEEEFVSLVTSVRRGK